MKTYAVDEIFKEIPEDPENVIMQIPDEICKELNWVENDVLTITIEDSKIIIKKNE
jgi:hypothetical protein